MEAKIGSIDDMFQATKLEVTISVSTMQGYKSAIVHLYKTSNAIWSSDIDNWVEEFIDGYAKLVSEKKENGIMPLQEGKSHMQFSAYLRVCQAMLHKSEEGIKQYFVISLYI